MTRQELCLKYEVSENSVLSHFPAVAKQIHKKYGVLITKEGRGDKATYFELNGGRFSPDDDYLVQLEFAIDVYKTITMEPAIFKGLVDWDFMVFLGIITTPMRIFRGSICNLLHFLGVENKGEANQMRLKAAIRALEEKGLIRVFEDNTTDEIWYSIWIVKSVEEGMKISIEMIQRCMKLQKENHMASWVPLLKTWVGLQFLAFDKDRQNEKVLFTMDELHMITGVNKNMLNKCKKILAGDNLFQTSRVFKNHSDSVKCIGQKIDLNGIECNYKVVLEQTK